MKACPSCTVLTGLAAMLAVGWKVETKRADDGEYCAIARHDRFEMLCRVGQDLTPDLTVECCGRTLENALIRLAHKTRTPLH